MRPRRSLTFAALVTATAFGWTAAIQSITRRSFLPGITAAGVGAGLELGFGTESFSPASASAAVISAPRCDSGVGDGCEANARDSELIKVTHPHHMHITHTRARARARVH